MPCKVFLSKVFRYLQDERSVYALPARFPTATWQRWSARHWLPSLAALACYTSPMPTGYLYLMHLHISSAYKSRFGETVWHSGPIRANVLPKWSLVVRTSPNRGWYNTDLLP